ncbi:MAG TPA: hypothetical protein VLG38_01865 [Gammaproteobacteria bacterium]|nr:hypothetical protein [Gammaproteobacteria bacterium]
MTILYVNNAAAHVDHGKYHDFRASKQSIELQKMQDFHLQQAKDKLHKKEFTHAWGDLAYLLCHVPNHHLALQHMLTLTPQLHKEAEMREYLNKAVTLFPEDAVVHMLYGAFLHNIGEDKDGAKHLRIANELSVKPSLKGSPRKSLTIQR